MQLVQHLQEKCNKVTTMVCFAELATLMHVILENPGEISTSIFSPESSQTSTLDAS